MKIAIGPNSKILIVGTSGSGKSTLAGRLAHRLNIKDIELDALHWGPNWTEASQDDFRSGIEKEIHECTGYVIHGNYNKVRDLTWGSVDTVIWLDYSKLVVMWRVITRTIIRIIKKEQLWAGNVESFSKSFLEKDSIVLWAWNTYEKRKEQYSGLFQDNPYQIKNLIRLRRPREARALLKNMEEF